jgi:hypothetical protein
MRNFSLSILLALAGLAGTAAQAADEGCPNGGLPKIAFVFEHRQASTADHANAFQAVARAFADTACVRSFDQIAAGVDPDANARFLLGTLGLENYALVVLTSRRHGTEIGKVARQFPATTYLHFNGASAAPNLIAYKAAKASEAKAGLQPFYMDAVRCVVQKKKLRAGDRALGGRTRSDAPLCE